MFSATDQFDPMEMSLFMRRPDIYWPTSYSMAPPPEAMDFVEHMLKPFTWTVAAMWAGEIIGYVQLLQRTSIMAEVTVSFHPQARGRIARTFFEYTMGRAFTERGLLKLTASIPSDNRRAIIAAYVMHFKLEGRLTGAIVRDCGICDLLLFGLNRDNVSPLSSVLNGSDHGSSNSPSPRHG